MRDDRRLAVFPKAHALALFVYQKVAPALPKDEKYGLAAQMKDCARSIPANLLEGCGRHTNRDLARFVDMSTGSANELRYYSMLCRDLQNLPPELILELEYRVVEVIRMLVALARTARTTPDLPPRKSPPAPLPSRRPTPSPSPRPVTSDI